MAKIIPPSASMPITDKGSVMEQPFRAWTREVTDALGGGSSSLDDNTLITATGTSESRTLGDRFADVPHVKDFGALGVPANDTVAIQNTVNSSGTINLGTGTYAMGDVTGLSTIIADDAVILYAGSSTQFNINVIGKLTIKGVTSTVSATNVTVSGSDLEITTDAPITGTHLLIESSSDESVQGLYPITGILGNVATVSGSNTKNTTGAFTATVRTFSFTAAGFEIEGNCNIEDLLVVTTGLYGIRAGGGVSSSPNRPMASVDLKNVGVANATYLGLTASNGSSMGLSNVGVFGCQYSVISFSCGSIIGTSVYSNESSNAGFRCESDAHMFIDGYFCANSGSETALASRYNSMLEMADGYIVDASIAGSIAQFSSYQSIRDTEIHNTGTYGIYSTDGSSTVVNNLIIRGSGTNSLRVIKGSSLFGINTIDITGDTPHFVEGSTRVEYNGVVYSGKTATRHQVVGNITANLRAAFTVTVTGILLADNPRLFFTLQTDLPNGLDFRAAHIADNTVRYYVDNRTDSDINLTDLDFTIHY